MKNIFAAFFSFSRVERLGITVVSFCITVVLIIRVTLDYWVHPQVPDPAVQARLDNAYASWLAAEAAGISTQNGTDSSAVTIASPFAFDPNTLDSEGFIRLGIPPNAVKGLLNWRRKGKHFYKADDLKPLYNLPEKTFNQIAPYVAIAESSLRSVYTREFKKGYPPVPDIIDLNTADSSLLDRGINGIGATLAHKIVERRTALGGFVSSQQLLEIYRFPDTSFRKIQSHLKIDLNTVHKMGLNTVSLERLKAHPYIGEKTAKNILLYRQGIKTYQRIEQLREVPLMNEEIYRKIAPYFVVD